MCEKIDIKEYLEQFAGRDVVFKPNPGNAGDSVIASATFQLFDQTNINYELFNTEIRTKDRILLYGGGGNLVPYYNNAEKFIRKHHESAGRLIILPHTVAGNEKLLGELSSNVSVICREKETYKHVLRYGKKCEILLSEDLAFSLNTNEIKKEITSDYYTIYDFVNLKWKVFKLTLEKKRKRLKNTLFCYRKDPESKMEISAMPSENIDLSEKLRYRVSRRNACDLTTQSFVNFIRQFEKIVTDRLHVGIVGCLLGKEVIFSSGKYHKIRSVYMHSIKDRFPNAKFR